MNYLYLFYIISLTSVVGLWTSFLFNKKWITLLTLVAFSAFFLYTPIFLYLLSGMIDRTFGIVGEALQFLFMHQGTPS